MFRTLPTAAALMVLVVAGALPRLLSARQPKVDWDALANRVNGVPMTIGDWQGEDLPRDEVTMRAAEAAGMFSRVYKNPKTNQAVSVLFLVGPPGPLSVHLPEVCYGGAGYRNNKSISSRGFRMGGESAKFRVVEMKKETNEPVPQLIRVYHTWNDGSGWSVPAVPRVAFGAAPCLFKLYVTTLPSSELPQGEKDPCVSFINACLPTLKAAVVPAEEPAKDAS